MAVPTFVAAGLLQESTTTLTVSDNITPTTGDYQLLILESAAEAATLTTSGGFTAFPGDIGSGAGIYTTGAAAGLTSTRMTVFERLYAGQADPVTNDPGNHVIANIFTFRKSSGAWTALSDVRSATVDVGWKVTIQATEVTAASMDGITTDTVDQLIVGITCAAKPDVAGGTTEMGAVTNGNLASITERFDDAAASGNGGWIGCWTGQEVSTGQAIGASTWTKTATSVMVHFIIALRDAAPGGTNGTATPSTVAAVAAVPAATARGGAITTPSTVAAVSAVPASTVRGGAVTTPSTVAAVAAVPASTARGGAITTPATVAAIADVPAATAIGTVGGDATAEPATVAAVAAVPAPTARGGAIASPSTVPAVAAVPAPTVRGAAVVSPATVAAVAAVPAATAQGGGRAVPNVVAAVAAVPSATARGAAVVFPTTVAAIAAVPTATAIGTISGDGLALPATVAAVASVPPPIVIGTSGIPESPLSSVGADRRRPLGREYVGRVLRRRRVMV